MIEEVIGLRKNRWVPRRDNNAPKTLQEIKDDAAKAEHEKEMMKRTASSGGRLPNMSQQFGRGGSQRGKDARGGSVGVPPSATGDGWSTVGSAVASRKAGDLGQFGKMDRSKSGRNISLGPSTTSVFTSLNKVKPGELKKEDKTPAAIPVGTPNMYSMLDQHVADVDKKDPVTPTERPKLRLLPRTTQNEIPSVLDSPSVESPAAITPSDEKKSLDPKEARKKIDSMIKEFWAVSDINELIYCIKELEGDYHSQIITELINSAVDKKPDDVKKVSKVFNNLNTEKIISKDSFKKSFAEFIETIEDLVIDAPQALAYGGQLIVAAQIEPKEFQELLKPLIETDFGPSAMAAKLTVEYLKALRASETEEVAVKKFKESGFDLKVLFAEDKRKDEDIATFLNDKDLAAFK